MDLFGPPSWLAVHIGQLNDPVTLDPLLHVEDGATTSRNFVERLAGAIGSMAESMPGHAAFLDRIGATQN